MDHPSSSIITQVSRDEEASTPLREKGKSEKVLKVSCFGAHMSHLKPLFNRQNAKDYFQANDIRDLNDPTCNQ